MNSRDIVRLRLANQQIANTKFKKAEEILCWLAAVQSQEFGMAKWALGLRLKDVDDRAIESSFNNGTILRTHLLRPTWHFVSAGDIRWMLALTASRVHAVNKYYYKKFELDSVVFKKANAILTKMLRDGKMMTRANLNEGLAMAKIKAEGLRLSYIFMQAELEGIICSGRRQGKQFTYALLDERVPAVKMMDRQESLAELSKRYFTSRGPATLQDFVWWSGLTVMEAREGISLLDQKKFTTEKIGSSVYILGLPSPPGGKNFQATFLMPDYDEYGISYKDRSALFGNVNKEAMKSTSSYSHMLIVDGVIAGTWEMIKGKSTQLEVKPFYKMQARQNRGIIKAIERYKSFLSLGK